MKIWIVLSIAVLALLFVAVPVSPRISTEGITASIDSAQAITYRRARVSYRRGYRRGARRAYRYAGATAGYYGAGYRRRCTCY